MDVPSLEPADEVAEWSDQADVVVCGFGAAGASAAIEAREAGAEVLVLERAGSGGGTSALAGGHFYLGGGTPVQQACGFHDTPGQMGRYLRAVTPEPDEEKIDLYCDGSVEHFHWLEAQGMPFDRSYYPCKHVTQPGRDCLIWSGNENVWPFRQLAAPAPRGHKVSVEGDGGPAIMEVLASRAGQGGTRVACDAHVTNLVAGRGGRIIGVKVRRDDRTDLVLARRGVVLSTGGFVMNQTMLKEWAPWLGPPIIPVGAPFDDGSGITLGVSAGAGVAHMEGGFVSATNYPPASLLKGIMVNAGGRRFVAEDSYHGRTGALAIRQPGGVAFLIVDRKIFGYPEFSSLPLIGQWETVEDTETGLGLPAGSLTGTIADYNRHAATADDPRWHKQPEWLQPLDAPPFAAFDASLGKAMYVGFTLGGLRTSADGEVLTSGGKRIPGLYASGACASNLVQDGLGYCSGIRLGEATFFGRRAGRRVARDGAGG